MRRTHQTNLKDTKLQSIIIEQKNVLLHFRIKIYENKTFTMTIHDSYARIFWTQIKIPFVVHKKLLVLFLCIENLHFHFLLYICEYWGHFIVF